MELTYKKSVNITRNININFVATIYDISFNQIKLSVHIPCYENDGIAKVRKIYRNISKNEEIHCLKKIRLTSD